jgi:hypothetical protein
MADTIVDRLYSEFQQLVEHLNKAVEPSLCSTAEDNFSKSLLLAAASYFEDRLSTDLLSFVDEASNKNELVGEFVRTQAISRKYFSLFVWESGNANKFFSCFGSSFSTFMKDEVKSDENLAGAIKAFIEIGLERNRLVHQNFGTFTLEKTAEEIFALYRTAVGFVDVIPNKLREYSIAHDATTPATEAVDDGTPLA